MRIDNQESFYEDPHAALSEVYKLMMERGSFPTDLYTNSIINRAMAINDGYIKLAKINNYIAAVPYIRMQMDNCICLYAGCLVDDVWKLVDHFVAGKRLSKLRDKQRNQLYEKYIVQKMNKGFPKFKQLYELYNDEVHLSDRHFSSSLFMTDNNRVELALNTEQFTVDAEIYNTNLWQVNRTMTHLLLHCWLHYKETCLDEANESDNLKQMIKEKLEYYPHIKELLLTKKSTD